MTAAGFPPPPRLPAPANGKVHFSPLPLSSIRQRPSSPRHGIALPLVLGAVLCFALWVIVLSQSVSQAQLATQKQIRQRRAYFMARSALQHFLLKVKHADRLNPAVVEAICAEEQPEDAAARVRQVHPPRQRRGTLAEMFVADVHSPLSVAGQPALGYHIESFLISSLNPQEMAVEITAVGRCETSEDKIRRVYRISR